MDYLRRQSVRIPEKFREQFPTYGGVKVAVYYWLVKDGSGVMASNLVFCLTPSNGPHRKFDGKYKKIHSQPGPSVLNQDHKSLVEHAKKLIKDPKFLEEILTNASTN